MHAAMANDTSVSEFCTEQGIWASIKPLTLHLYVNPEGQLRAQCTTRRVPLTSQQIGCHLRWMEISPFRQTRT